MIRRTFLRQVVFAAAGLAAGAALADPVDEIIAEIREQGFRIVRVQRTWLGRVRIIGQNAGFRREVVIDPTTGEIKRDLLIPRKGAAPAEPDLGGSRGVGTIEEEGPRGEGDSPDGSDESNWGGGWGDRGAGEDGADAN